MAQVEVSRDDTLSALTGIVNSRLTETHENTRVVIWRLSNWAGGQGGTGLSADIFTNGAHITFATVYGQDLTDLSQVATTLAESVERALVAQAS